MNERIFVGMICIAAFVIAFSSETGAQFPFPKIKLPKPAPASAPLPVQSGDGRPTAPPGSAFVSTATEPTIRKSGVIVAAQTYSQYYANPSATQYDDLTWSWVPILKIQVNGPIPSGSVIAVEYTKPDGKTWLSYDCDTPETPADRMLKAECGRNLGAKNGIVQTGIFGFAITIRNELKGTNSKLFTGKFKVDKFVFNPANNPKYNKNWVYWINEDWRLPIGFVYAAEHGRECSMDCSAIGPEASQLIANIWFRGTADSTRNIEGHLFYQGNEVASTSQGYGTASEIGGVIPTTGSSGANTAYHLMTLHFNALVYDNNTNPRIQNNGFPMYKNPGAYEIKVLQNGHLSRTAKFTMGGDGRLADNGIANANNLGTGDRIAIPVLVIGTQDAADLNAWKTDAFYGNLLTGFNLP